MRDSCNLIHVLPLFVPAAATMDNTPWVSNIIPVSGYESVTFAMVTGVEADADATFAVAVQDGNDPALADAANVDPSLLVGTLAQASFRFDDDAESRKIGYVGYKQYVRLTVTPANNSAAAFLAGVAILGRARSMPTPNPPM